jgi:HEPN domain-containing protein
VPADQAAVRRRLELAELNVARAEREQASGDADAALIFAEQALINSADAMLARDGYSANSHVVRFSYPLLPTVYVSERGLIDRIRSARNTAQYDARDSVSPGLAVQAIQLAERALAEVRAIL